MTAWPYTHRISRLILCGVLVCAMAVISLPAAEGGDPRYDLKILKDRVRGSEPKSKSAATPIGNGTEQPVLAGPILPPVSVPSPGMMLGQTPVEEQHLASQGRQVARQPGSNFVHFTWIDSCWICLDPWPNLSSQNVYACYDIAQDVLIPEFPSPHLWPDYGFAGGPRLDVDSDNLAHVVFHMYPDFGSETYSLWHVYFPIEGTADILLPEELPLLIPFPPSTVFPDIAVAANAGVHKDNANDVLHVIATSPADESGAPPHIIAYWRYDYSNPDWPAPVIIDSTDIIGYVIDAADGTDQVAVAFHTSFDPSFNGLNNIAIRESQTGGAGWLSGNELGDDTRTIITNYTDPATPGPQAYVHISIAYDHDANLHLVWDEQRRANLSEQVAIKHWSSATQSISTVARGYYPNNGNWEFNLNLAKITLGVGDGSTMCTSYGPNEDFLYVTYSKHCGETPEERGDTAVTGRCNSELYLVMSPDGGSHWSKPANLTNTKTPNCNALNADSVCVSEDWATIGRDVSDVDIFYIADLNPGPYDAATGERINVAMYLRLPGGTTDDPLFCPGCHCPCHGDPNCDAIINVFDVVAAVDAAFRSVPCEEYLLCAVCDSDINCDGMVNVFDVVTFVDVAFRAGDPVLLICDPCSM